MKGDPRKINKSLKFLNKHSLEVGILGTGDTVSVNGEMKKEENILYYATLNEFGGKNIPPRPFMLNALTENKTSIEEYQEKIMNDVISGKLEGINAYKKLGLYIVGLIVVSIRTAEVWAKPLSERTKEKKRNTNPNRAELVLIDSGAMIRMIRFGIKRKGFRGGFIFKSEVQKVGVGGV